MEKNKLFVLILLLVILLTIFTGCKEESFVVHELSEGFYYDENILVPPSAGDQIAYRTKVNLFNIDEVSLQVSFGRSSPVVFYEDFLKAEIVLMPIECYLAEKNCSFRKHSNKKIIVKEITDYLTDEYAVTLSLEEKRYKFNHTEDIAIPREMFLFDLGGICIQNIVWEADEMGTTYGIMTSISIYYMKNGDTIYLYKEDEANEIFRKKLLG